MDLEELCDIILNGGDEEKLKEVLASGDVDVNGVGRFGCTPLSIAMERGEPEIVKLLLANENTKLDIVNSSNETGLHRACAHTNSRMECVQLFVNDERCTPEILNMKQRDQMSALFMATAHGPVEFVQLLSKLPGVDVNTRNQDNNSTPLSYAMENIKPDKVKALLANKDTKLDVFPQDDMENKSALWEAVWSLFDYTNASWYRRYDALDCIKYFVADERCTGDIVNHKFRENTALSKAVKDGNADVVKILAIHPATDFKSVDYDDKTVLDAAIEKGDKNIVELVKQRIAIQEEKEEGRNEKLKEFVSNLDKTQMNDDVFRVCSDGDVDTMRDILASRDMDINKRGDWNGRTLLIVAMERGWAGVVELLLSHKKTKLDIVDYDGNTGLNLAGHKPFNWTKEYNWKKCIQLFINDERCTEEVLNIKNNEGESALYGATKRGHVEFVRILAEMPGIDPNSKHIDLNTKGYTPLLLAMRFDMADKVRALLANKNTKLDVVTDKQETALALNVQCVCLWTNWSEKSAGIDGRQGYERTECIKLFTEDERFNNKIVNLKDVNGRSPLWEAVNGSNAEEVVNVLAELGADFKSIDNDGKTVLDVAIEKGNETILEIVQKKIAIQESYFVQYVWIGAFVAVCCIINSYIFLRK